jgi:hypothetical protein
MKKSTKKVLENVACGICLIVLIWGFASFIDVNAHNMSDYQYASWNLFNIFDHFN